jgi:hypothetical protein
MWGLDYEGDGILLVYGMKGWNLVNGVEKWIRHVKTIKMGMYSFCGFDEQCRVEFLFRVGSVSRIE